MKKPDEIIKALTAADLKLLNEILNIEKSRLHVDDIKTNSRIEKEIITEISASIDKVVSDED